MTTTGIGALTDEEDLSYYGDVEAHFVERRGSPLFITPAEWALVAKWEEQGIPVHVVKDGIDRVFERPKAAVKPRKLGYCRQTVEAAFRRFREVSLGAGGSRAPIAGGVSVRDDRLDVVAHLSLLATKLADVAPELAEQVSRLQVSGDNLQGIEDILTEIEEQLIDGVEAALDTGERDLLGQAAARSLASYRDRMPEKVYESALKSAYRRRLRDRSKLPRLSLLDR